MYDFFLLLLLFYTYVLFQFRSYNSCVNTFSSRFACVLIPHPLLLEMPVVVTINDAATFVPSNKILQDNETMDDSFAHVVVVWIECEIQPHPSRLRRPVRSRSDPNLFRLLVIPGRKKSLTESKQYPFSIRSSVGYRPCLSWVREVRVPQPHHRKVTESTCYYHEKIKKKQAGLPIKIRTSPAHYTVYRDCVRSRIYDGGFVVQRPGGNNTSLNLGYIGLVVAIVFFFLVTLDLTISHPGCQHTRNAAVFPRP